LFVFWIVMNRDRIRWMKVTEVFLVFRKNKLGKEHKDQFFQYVPIVMIM